MHPRYLHDYFPAVAPINDGNILDAGYLAGVLDWTGNSTISVTSIPDVNNISTWTWTAEYYGSGTSLAVAPEPNSSALGGLGGLISFLMFRRVRLLKLFRN